jgi:NAD(P)-dependent dehydrogenase (short-subunit alcohol dehydrogenase family)
MSEPTRTGPEPGVCIITGGGRGIGAAVARRLAVERPEWTQVLTWVGDEASARAVADEVRAAGATALTVRADVAVEDEVLALFAVADEAGPLRGLVNNAGVVLPIGRLEDMATERIARTMAVNVVGTMVCAREAVRRMSTGRGGGGGVIVNLSSRAASFGSPGEFVDYAASKGAVDTFTIGLATEVAREGIRVNAVRPGLIETEIHASAGRPDRVAELAGNVPMGRGGTADEVAASICWLLSDDASYVTGALLDVGGGR